MPDKAPDGWRSESAREFEAQPAATETIAVCLRFKLAKIISEPLPEKMTGLLNELQRRRSPWEPWRR